MTDQQPPDDAVTPSARVSDLLAKLTREEKLAVVHGAVDPAGNATGYLPGVPRLDIPALRLTDGPLGIRTDRPATAFPASIALAASFDPELARQQGNAMAREAAARNQDVLLAPGLNIVRVPHCGRSFEYYSEDPVVTGRFAAAAVEGIQSEGVIATPKHFVANSQETRRAEINAAVDERVLRELYLRGFRDAVDAGAGALMTAYNRVNGTFMSEHGQLVRQVLKAEWGFDGFVMSDWFGTESAARAATGGLDVEMPGTSLDEQFESMGVDPETVADEMDPAIAEGMPNVDSGGLFAADLDEAVETGAVPESRLDDMVVRVLGQMERFGLLDGDDSSTSDEVDDSDIPAHREIAERIATRGTVLVKNESLLPLDSAADVAVIGPNVDEAILGGGGSSETTPFDRTSPLVGITARAAGAVDVAHGVPPIEPVSMFDGLLDEEADEDDAATAPLEAVDTTIDDAVDAAREADVAVVFVRDTATEAADRETLELPGEQDALVEAVADAAERTVVVVNSSGPVELPWRESVDAILIQWYPGQAHGEAIAAVLYGDCDPGGRLPVTFAASEAYPTADERRFPGVDGTAHYDEGLLVGYRHFDATDAEPTYPFGHGQSYATFEYTDLAVDGGNDPVASVTVENTSDRDGIEVVQAYVGPGKGDHTPTSDGLARPLRELAGFAAVEIPAGASRSVEVDLDERALGRYDREIGWTVDPGEYTVSVGRSASDLRLQATLRWSRTDESTPEK
jgi:beta-glucosidase